MSAPTVTGVTYDQAVYNPGQPGKVTVTGVAGTSVSTHMSTGTATFTDTVTGLTASLSGPLSVTSPVEDATTATFTDTDGRVYTLVSISQTPGGAVTAVWSFTA